LGKIKKAEQLIKKIENKYGENQDIKDVKERLEERKKELKKQKKTKSS